MGHTDVVPVNPKTWTRDPFGGDLVDGEVWGRGAIDMLNLTASQAVALKALARQGWRPKGTLVYLACADEEAGGTLGAGHVCDRALGLARSQLSAHGERRHGQPRRALGRAECHRARRGERGGLAPAARPRHPWTRLHALAANNALVKAAKVVDRLAAYRPSAVHRRAVERLRRLARPRPGLKAALVDPTHVDESIARLVPGMAKYAWSATHTTFSPNVCHGGVKTNVIPDVVDVEVDIRTIPGDNEDEVRRSYRQGPGRPGRKRSRVEKLFSQAGVDVPDRHPALGRPGAGSWTRTTRARSSCPA